MIDNVRKLIAQIQKTAEQVAASSEELTASADQSAEVTQTIAKSIADVSGLHPSGRFRQRSYPDN